MANSPTVRRRHLGRLLRERRGELGLTARQVGEDLDRSESWILRVERGNTGVRRTDLRAVMDLYGITDPAVRKEMEDLARAGRERGWWSKYRSVLPDQYAAYIGFEAEASRLLVWQSLVVDGLLQTEDYARAVFRAAARTSSTADIERPLRVRMQRQERLTADPPLEMDVVLDEAVLHRVILGDRKTHVAQLDHLLDVARNLPTVRLQVVPFADAGHPGMLPSFTVLEFTSGDRPIAYVEGVTGDIYEEDAIADRLILVHGDLRAAALSESRTIELIEQIRDTVAT